jgi:hypothetical protein
VERWFGAWVLAVLVLEDLFTVIFGLPRLTAADLASKGAAIDRRGLDEIRACVFCGEQARAPVICGPSDLIGPAAWLDLCSAHNRALRELFLNNPFLDDPEIIRRYEEWAHS